MLCCHIVKKKLKFVNRSCRKVEKCPEKPPYVALKIQPFEISQIAVCCLCAWYGSFNPHRFWVRCIVVQIQKNPSNTLSEVHYHSSTSMLETVRTASKAWWPMFFFSLLWRVDTWLCKKHKMGMQPNLENHQIALNMSKNAKKFENVMNNFRQTFALWDLKVKLFWVNVIFSE